MSWSYSQKMAGADDALKNMVSNVRASQDLVGGRAQDLFNQYDAAKKKIKDKFDKYSSMAENVGKQLEGVAGTMEGGAFTSHHLAPGLKAMGSGTGDVEGGLKALAGRIRGRVAGRQIQGYADRVQIPEGRAADATNALYRQQDREASTAIQKVVRGKLSRIPAEVKAVRAGDRASGSARDAAKAAQRYADVATEQPNVAVNQYQQQTFAKRAGSSVARSAANDAETAAESADRSIRGAVGNAAGSAARGASSSAGSAAQEAEDAVRGAVARRGARVVSAAARSGGDAARGAASSAGSTAQEAEDAVRGAVARRGARVVSAAARSGGDAARGAASSAGSAAQEAEEAAGRAATTLNRSSIKRFQSLDTAKYQGSSSAREAAEAASSAAGEADRATTAARSQQWLEKSPGAATTITRRARGVLGRASAAAKEEGQDLAAVRTQSRAMRSGAYRVAEDDPIRVGGAGREPATRTLQRVRRGQVGRDAAVAREGNQTAEDVQTQARSYAQLRPSEEQQTLIDLARRFGARDVDFQRINANYSGNNAISASRGAAASAQTTRDAMDTLGPELDTMRATKARLSQIYSTAAGRTAAGSAARGAASSAGSAAQEAEDAVRGAVARRGAASTMQRGVRRLADARTSGAQQAGSSAASDAASAAQRAADSAESDANASQAIRGALTETASTASSYDRGITTHINPLMASRRAAQTPISGGDSSIPTAADRPFNFNNRDAPWTGAAREKLPPSLGERIGNTYDSLKETLSRHVGGAKQYVADTREGAEGAPKRVLGTFEGEESGGGMDYDMAGIPIRSVGKGAQAISRAARTSASAADEVGDTATDMAATSLADAAGGVGDALEMAGAALDATGVGAALGIGLGLVGAAVGIGGAAAEVVGDIRDEVSLHTDIGNKVTQMAYAHGAGMSGGAPSAAISTSRGVTQNMHGGF
tara:strand:- start:5673 stop:8498 length:2826 start_codon:yes stop_codon:yes gene_type:complete